MKTADTSKSSYDLNALLSVANILICGLTIYLYFTVGDTDYTNLFTVLLVCLFTIENILMLSYEKRRRNPFILILVLVVTVFYMMRIPILIWLPSSAGSFQLLSIKAIDLNYALTFILLANASMFLGFYIGKKHNVNRINLSFSNETSPKVKNAIIIMIFLILINFFGVLDPEIFGRLSGFLSGLFCNLQIILLFTFAILVYHYDNISQKLRILFIIIFLCMVILITLSGSRSGLLFVGMLLLFSVLAVKQKFIISKRLLLLSLILIPIAYISFVSADFKRRYSIQEKITTKHLYMAIDERVFDWSQMEYYSNIIFSRIGFLDFSTILIRDKQKYSVILNGKYYIKSTIDNVLTPGFDVFGTTRISYALSYVTAGRSVPSKDQAGDGGVQSDQLGIYGEYYVLFNGYPALAALFFIALMFQRVFDTFKTTNVLLSCLYKAVMLNLFYIYMNSFGSDWFALDIISAIITTFLFTRFYVSHGKRKFFVQLESKKDDGVYICKVI